MSAPTCHPNQGCLVRDECYGDTVGVYGCSGLPTDPDEIRDLLCESDPIQLADEILRLRTGLVEALKCVSAGQEMARLAIRSRDRAEAALVRVAEVHAHYFDLDSPANGSANPETEDVWRFDRDFRAALAGPTT